MKKLFLPLFASLPLTLMSCGQMKNKNAIYEMNGYNGPSEITAETVLYMVKSHYAFPILLHVDGCEHCVKALNVAKQYTEKYHKQIFTCEITMKSFEMLNKEYPNIFKDFSYPRFYILDTYGLHYEVSTSAIQNYANFKKEVNSQFKDTHFHYVDTLSTFADLKAKYDNYLLYTYDSSNTDYNNSYLKLFQTGKKLKKNVLIVDKFSADSALNEYLSDSDYIASWVENGQIKTTVNYINDNDGYNNLLKSFFDVNTVNSSF